MNTAFHQGFDILLTGVGGQGTVLASRILAEAALNRDIFVRTSETIGMAQRGGSVTSHVRLNSEALSPMINQGDLLIAFEPSEGLRNLNKLKTSAKLLVNTKEIQPVTAALNPNSYQITEIIATLQQNPNTILVDGYELALQAGNIKTLNTVLLGAASKHNLLPFSKGEILAAMAKIIPPKLYQINETAFNLGCQ